MKEKVRSLLTEIGFSGSEAEIYLALLAEPGASGYRVAQLVGKPAANTYKSLDSLRIKGAVVMDESSGTKTYVALSIHEYLDGVRRNLETRQEEAERELANLAVSPMRGGIFQLTSAAQVYERVRNMLASAETVVLVDAFPKPLDELRDELCRASRRGVKVFIKAYAPVALDGCEVVCPEEDSPQLRIWDGDWLNVSVDCREFVQSFLKKDGRGVHEAMWSRNPYVAALTYNGIVSEFVLTRSAQFVQQAGTVAAVRDEMRRLFRLYMQETPMREVIPSNWLTEWARKQKKKLKRPGRPGRKRGSEDGVSEQ